MRFSCRPIAALFQPWRVFSGQFRSPQELLALQTRKLRRLVRTAYENVPYYRRRFDACGLSPAGIQTIEDLKQIPITTKADLQACRTEEILDRGIAPETLSSEHSSGSTGQPFRVYYDPAYRCIRSLLFFRGLIAAGYRPGQKVQLVTSPGKRHKPWLRWHYSSILDPPERLLAELNHARPELLYGCKTALIRLAEHIRGARVPAHRPKRVISTAELLNSEDRALLEEEFAAPVFDFYGSTEMGLVGWECRAGGGFHLSADSVLVEFLPVPGNAELSRMVMTNLDLKAMPLIRYESGDLGLPGPPGRCRCGRRLPKLHRVEGRQNDCLKTRDGRRISPYRLTCTMEKIPGILKYQVIQTGWDDFTVKLRAAEKLRLEAGAQVRKTMRSLLGAEIRLSLDFIMPMESAGARKFRVIESRLPSP